MFHHKMLQNKRPGRNPVIIKVAKILLVGADSNSVCIADERAAKYCGKRGYVKP